MALPAPERLQTAYHQVLETIQSQALPSGHWEGQLSASALSTATAVATLALWRDHTANSVHACALSSSPTLPSERVTVLIENGIKWLLDHQNPDGGWGDTILSHSNIATSWLVRAALELAAVTGAHPTATTALDRYLQQQGGVAAVHARYGTDRTFSAPILTQCALAGLVDWREVAALPFELAWLPHQFYKMVRLPVVSYALPALIAIGQIRHQQRPTWFWPWRWLRDRARQPTLNKLTTLQPASGGFLEATPLTSFVCMSLIGLGELQHPVVRLGLEFLDRSVLADGSWPIDTNLATWVTTLTINHALPETLPSQQRQQITDWLLQQQLQTVHPYTQAAPGGWAWTDLTGGVPDADDTSGAVLAVLKLADAGHRPTDCRQAARRGIQWLLDLQNRDGGWPTFCRGWGTLPFDRSSADITAHALRALAAAKEQRLFPAQVDQQRCERARQQGFRYLEHQQRPDGSWLPLWFGNQHAPADENPLYGTAKVWLAYRDWEQREAPAARKAWQWLIQNQNADGGWGGQRGNPSSVEETSLALEVLSTDPQSIESTVERGWAWLLARIDNGSVTQPSPIGFYFAKLWYFEQMYPLTFALAALRQACETAKLAP